MFDAAERERIRVRLIELARHDSRIAAAAAVGSTAEGGDRWSDLDLTFGVAAGLAVAEVLADWSDAVVAEFGAAVLFDLPVNTTIYRVFLFPGALQVDLSFSPIADFGPRGPRFRLIFGQTAFETWPPPAPLAAEFEFGLAVHHLVRANVCIERGRLWQAEYWLHEARDIALTLACHRLGLDTHYARGFDRLPPEVLDGYADTLVKALTVTEVRRALAAITDCLLHEGDATSPTGHDIRALLAVSAPDAADQ
ncbi:MAG: hypothetical protein IT336_08455 [Thermomicrobiales bacterium]|nr:hypothetical protein [Thermomicrobiales bacterium]